MDKREQGGMSTSKFYLFSVFLGLLILAFIRWMIVPLGLPIPGAYLPILMVNIVFGGMVYRILSPVGDPRTFTSLYLGSLVLKLLVHLGLMVAVGLNDPAGQVSNAIFLLISYVLFTVLEIGFLYPKDRKS